MERIIENILEHKKIVITFLVLIVLIIILLVVKSISNNKLNENATDNKILINRLSVNSEDNRIDEEDLLEINLDEKLIKHYIRYSYNEIYDDIEVADTYYDYHNYGSYNMNDTEFKKVNYLIKSILDNQSKYNDIGEYYNGIPEKVIIENNKMLDENKVNNTEYYTIYYYKVYSADNKDNITEIGTIYLEDELRFVEYLYNIDELQ